MFLNNFLKLSWFSRWHRIWGAEPRGTHRRGRHWLSRVALLTALTLCGSPASHAFDIDRAFRNFDLVASGQVGASELTDEERAEVLMIQNTFDQMERNNTDALEWADCHSAETLARQQAGQLGAMSRRLASCARRNDLSSLLSAANGLESCALGGGGLDHCNSRMRSAERFRGNTQACQTEIRDAAREQRHLATFRLRQAEMCPLEPVL